ncbi:uncharacterized protein LOC144798572 [Lissotriton helveticus]
MVIVGALILLQQLLITHTEGPVITLTPNTLLTEVGGVAEMNCTSRKSMFDVFWYKEQLDGTLIFLHQSEDVDSVRGTYSGKSPSGYNTRSLVINNTQRRHSGVYYCAIFTGTTPFLSSKGTLYVTDATSAPIISILLPGHTEEPQLREPRVILCVASGVSEEWGPVLWKVNGRDSHGQRERGVFDAQGLFTMSGTLVIPQKIWDQAKSCTCSITNNSTGQTFSAVYTKHIDNACGSVMAYGISCCLALLLIQLLLLVVCRKRLLGRKQPRIRLEMSETAYATVK